MDNIQAVILAGGVGERLKPLTDKTPKPLIKVKGKPVIGWVYENLKKHGIEDILVNVHHLPLEIPRYLGKKVEYLYEGKLSGTAGVLKILEDQLTDPFVVVNGDTISNVNVKEMLDYHEDVTVFTLDTAIHNGGCFVFSKSILKHIPKNQPYSIQEDLIPKLIEEKVDIFTYRPKDSYYFDIGTPEKLEKARKFFEKKLIYCPRCEANGEKNVLGEIDEDGDFVVLRFSKGLTRVSGREFEVICKCGERVFYRRSNGK